MRLVMLVWSFSWLILSPHAVAQEGRWWRAESAHFIVYGDRSAQQVSNIAVRLEDFDATLRAITGGHAGHAQNKLNVYVVRSHSDLRQAWPSISEFIIGFYRAGLEETAAFMVESNLYSSDRNTTLQHEYAHHFMLQYFPFAYPKWYIEGWAEYVSTIEIRDRRARVGVPSIGRSSWVASGEWLPIEDMLAPERVEGRNNDRFGNQFYAQSWFATLFVANRPERRRGLDAYVRALGEGADPIEAFEPAFGITPADFDSELRAFRRSGNVSLLAVNLPDALPEVEVTQLQPVFDDLLLPMARVRTGGVGDEGSGAVATDFERFAGAHTGHPVAQMALARAAILRKDWPLAKAALRAIIEADPLQANARYLLAEVVLEEARANGTEQVPAAIAEARRELARGFSDDPNHAPTLFLYASLFAAQPEPMTAEQLEVLARALELAPQVSRMRLLLAEELMEAGYFESAIATLRPVAYAPHNPSVAARAQTLLTAARRGERAPAELEGASDEASEVAPSHCCE